MYDIHKVINKSIKEIFWGMYHVINLNMKKIQVELR